MRAVFTLTPSSCADAVKPNPEQLEAFFAALCKTDMELDENILSKAEYEKAVAGKRHFRDHVAV